jgi:hypothetical protein
LNFFNQKIFIRRSKVKPSALKGGDYGVLSVRESHRERPQEKSSRSDIFLLGK